MIKKLLYTPGNNFTRNKYSFLILNSLGWFLFGFSIQIILISANAANTRNTISNLILYVSGYLTTFIIRYFYKKFVPRSLSGVKPWISIFILCLIHAHIWFIIDLVLYGLTLSDFIELYNNYLQLSSYLRTIIMNMFRLLAWSFLYFFIKTRIDLIQLSERKNKAELHAKNLEIQMLRYQLNPHFLFNSLNSIRALTLKDVSRSREMISELSEFLRYTLMSKNNSTITLSQEIEAVKHFCVIEKIRFQDKLDISFAIEPETESILVPPLILHPIIENAIKFGMETSHDILKVAINTFKKKDQVIIEITNTGKWIDDEERENHKVAGTNTGLKNVKQILENIYPQKHKFEIITEENLVKVRITMNLIGKK